MAIFCYIVIWWLLFALSYVMLRQMLVIRGRVVSQFSRMCALSWHKHYVTFFTFLLKGMYMPASKKKTIVLASRLTDNHISQMLTDLHKQVNLVLNIGYVIWNEGLILHICTNYICIIASELLINNEINLCVWLASTCTCRWNLN